MNPYLQLVQQKSGLSGVGALSPDAENSRVAQVKVEPAAKLGVPLWVWLLGGALAMALWARKS